MTGPADTARGGGQSGITLLEVLIALAVVALAMAMAAGGLRVLARSGDRGAQIVARHETLSRGIDVLRRDIERLERVIRPGGAGAEFVFQGDATGLRFVVIEPPFPTEAGLYLVGYAILERSDGVLLVRNRVPFQGLATDIERTGAGGAEDSVAVIEGSYGLRFQYFDRSEGGRWLPQWSDPHRLPDLIGLAISGPGGAPMPQIVFRPRIDAEAGCVEDGGGACTIGAQEALAPEVATEPGRGN